MKGAPLSRSSGKDSVETSPKRLLVGVNSTFGLGVLIELLVEKELITLEEFKEVLDGKMKMEVKDYEDRVRALVEYATAHLA